MTISGFYPHWSALWLNHKSIILWSITVCIWHDVSARSFYLGRPVFCWASGHDHLLDRTLPFVISYTLIHIVFHRWPPLIRTPLIRTTLIRTTLIRTTLIWTLVFRPLLKVPKNAYKYSPLKCGHPSLIRTLVTGTKGGRFRGVPLYLLAHLY